MENSRIVVDTNVFISSIIGQYSFPHKIFKEFIFTGEVILCLSEEVFTEYASVSKREKFKQYQGFEKKSTELLLAIGEIAEFYSSINKIAAIEDEPDNKILELAVAAKAKVIITGNHLDFSFKEFEGITIKSPKQFYEEFIGSKK